MVFGNFHIIMAGRIFVLALRRRNEEIFNMYLSVVTVVCVDGL